MVGMIMQIDGQNYGLSQTGKMRPIPEGPRRKIDREKAREFRAFIVSNISRCQTERDRLRLLLKAGPAKYYAVRESNRRNVSVEMRRWESILSGLNDALERAGVRL